jgi:predicted nuclease of predicted toxin-antitoxin system
VRFLVDMPLSAALARWPRELDHDAVHAAERGFDRSPNAEILAAAAAEARTVVTADLDYPRLLALASATSPSLILFRGGDWGEQEVIHRMGELLTSLHEGDMAATIFVIERGRVRRRRLPIT